MSGRFKRFRHKSLKESIETDNKDNKDIQYFTTSDGSVTVVKKEEVRKNYRNNKIIRNDEDAKIIQDFCRKNLKVIMKKQEEEEKLKKKQKEQEESQSSSRRGYFSKYRRSLIKQQEGTSLKNSVEKEKINNDTEINKSKNLNESAEKNKGGNQTEQNNEESNNGKKFHRRRFLKNSQNSNQISTQEKEININSTSSGKMKNEQEETNNVKNVIILRRKKFNSEEKKAQREEELKPKFLPTYHAYHEKKKYEQNYSQLENENDPNYKYQVIEAIPVKFYDDYFNNNSRMRFLSQVKPLYVQPYLNPNIIITEIKFDSNYIPRLQSSYDYGYASGITNNIKPYRSNISRNDNLLNNKNSYRTQIIKTQYKNDYKYTRPFANIDNSRNVYL